MRRADFAVQKNDLIVLMDKAIKKERWVEVVELARKLDDLDCRAVELGLRRKPNLKNEKFLAVLEVSAEGDAQQQ